MLPPTAPPPHPPHNKPAPPPPSPPPCLRLVRWHHGLLHSQGVDWSFNHRVQWACGGCLHIRGGAVAAGPCSTSRAPRQRRQVRHAARGLATAHGGASALLHGTQATLGSQHDDNLTQTQVVGVCHPGLTDITDITTLQCTHAACTSNGVVTYPQTIITTTVQQCKRLTARLWVDQQPPHPPHHPPSPPPLQCASPPAPAPHPPPR